MESLAQMPHSPTVMLCIHKHAMSLMMFPYLCFDLTLLNEILTNVTLTRQYMPSYLDFPSCASEQYHCRKNVSKEAMFL